MTGSVSIAKPYAKAAFEFAQVQGELAQWRVFLQYCAQFAEQTELQQYWLNPRVSREQAAQILLDLVQLALTEESRLPETQQNFIRLLAENRRLSQLTIVASLFNELCASEQQLINVEVVSAHSLSQAQQDELREKLKHRWRCDIALHCRINESLLAGMIIRTNDTVIDGSARGKLQRMVNHLVS